MEQILTAKELFDKLLSVNDEVTSTEMMIEFAKLHVEAALKAAVKDVEIKPMKHAGFYMVDSGSILNSYPLENIK
jgi:hypothetical protein